MILIHKTNEAEHRKLQITQAIGSLIVRFGIFDRGEMLNFAAGARSRLQFHPELLRTVSTPVQLPVETIQAKTSGINFSQREHKMIHAYMKEGMDPINAVENVKLHIASGMFDEYYQQRFG